MANEKQHVFPFFFLRRDVDLRREKKAVNGVKPCYIFPFVEKNL